ncbi:hypothetical protein GJ688_01835 [Heliobacillus mobilis]|uniref:Uncharacterized protein n=1 Tax=Heliobacterium mobile TaxID=28064 RepID=A0A6I3SBN3_HELMO|nr:hypothetical protein [Heliobacterium mobile]MTV47722.1 hypothetical protein [Heliobacterium mobile]
MRKELNDLKILISRDTLSKTSGRKKQVFKYCLCSIFINLITGNHLSASQELNISIAKMVLTIHHKDKSLNIYLENFKNEVEKSFELRGFLKPYNDEKLNKIISFFRELINKCSKETVTMIQVSEVSRIINAKQFFNKSSVSDHHWLQFDTIKGLIPTYPEMIIFNDLKVQWNYYVDVFNQINNWEVTDRKSLLENITNRDNRALLYQQSALYRQLIFLSVTYVESYLYNLYYTILNSNYLTKDKLESLNRIKKIDDTYIIDKILYDLFPQIKNSTLVLYENYKKMLRHRDRYVHASPFKDLSTNKSQLEPLLDINNLRLFDFLQTSIDFVKIIDDNLPNTLKLLFWWYDDNIKFIKMLPLSLTNENVPKKHYY